MTMCPVKVIGTVSDTWYWYFDKELPPPPVDSGVHAYSPGASFCLHSLLPISSHLCSQNNFSSKTLVTSGHLHPKYLTWT